MAPVTFTRRAGRPRYPLAVIDPDGNLKGQIVSVLEAHGVTCDEILLVMDEVKADRSKLGDYFSVRWPSGHAGRDPTLGGTR